MRKSNMAEPTHDTLKRALQTADGLYHRLVLLVGEAGSGKTDVLRAMAADLDTAVINVNLALSRELLELTAKQRSLRLPGILDHVVENTCSPVLLDHLEILFDQDLKQDPLRLLQGLSRNRAVVASWNGTLTGGKLVYAAPDHPEYRRYDAVDLLIVSMDGTATANLATQH